MAMPRTGQMRTPIVTLGYQRNHTYFEPMSYSEANGGKSVQVLFL